jgi:2-phosphoglycolate phosphatase
MLNTPIKAILFDLDGTLLDTAIDLVNALNSLRDAPLPFTAPLRAAAGRGCKGLIKTGLNIEDHDPRYPALSERLLTHYEKHLLDNTQLFAGMEEVLDYLDQTNIPWGIVTNKPDKYTQKILKQLQLTSRAKCIISGDTLANRKPHPEPLLHGCQTLQIKPQHCLYIGDSEIDIIASKGAGMPSLAATYGYIDETENPQLWNADGYIKQPKEILTLNFSHHMLDMQN